MEGILTLGAYKSMISTIQLLLGESDVYTTKPEGVLAGEKAASLWVPRVPGGSEQLG